MKLLTQMLLGEIMATRTGTVDPSQYPDEMFDLYSIPAFDKGEPDVLLGQDIGSAKQVVQPGDVLLSKIVPHIRRSWVVGRNRGRRLIASGEWIVFRSGSFHASYLRHVLTSDRFHGQFMGTVAGVGLGLALNELLARTRLIDLPADIYYIGYLPVVARWPEIAAIGGVALLITFLATLYPARQVSRRSPLDGLRYG